MSARFKDKKVLVTGAASGIGLGVASAFNAEGAAVVMLADMRLEAAQEALAGLAEPDRATAVRLDVSAAREVDGVLKRCWEDHDGIDFLINCAGIYPSDPVLEMDERGWDAVLDTNLKGPFLCSQAFSREAVARDRGGSIVNITSGAARRARPGAAHYCTSKAGLEMLTRALALELAQHGIRVNAVSPGFVSVDSEVNPLSQEYVAAISSSIPLGRAGQASDVARAVLFLCSEEAEWVTGTSVSVDGGSGAGDPSLPLSRPETIGGPL